MTLPRLFAVPSLLLLLASRTLAANAGTVVALEGAVTKKLFTAGDNPAAAVVTVQRQKMLLDTVSGDYTVIDLKVVAGKKTYHVSQQGTMMPTVVPIDAHSAQTATVLLKSLTGSAVTVPNVPTVNDGNSFVQMVGLNNAMVAKAAGLAAPFPAALSFSATAAGKGTVPGPLPLTTLSRVGVNITTGTFALNVPLTKTNSTGVDYATALQNLYALLKTAGYTAE